MVKARPSADNTASKLQILYEPVRREKRCRLVPVFDSKGPDTKNTACDVQKGLT